MTVDTLKPESSAVEGAAAIQGSAKAARRASLASKEADVKPDLTMSEQSAVATPNHPATPTHTSKSPFKFLQRANTESKKSVIPSHVKKNLARSNSDLSGFANLRLSKKKSAKELDKQFTRSQTDLNDVSPSSTHSNTTDASTSSNAEGLQKTSSFLEFFNHKDRDQALGLCPPLKGAYTSMGTFHHKHIGKGATAAVEIMKAKTTGQIIAAKYFFGPRNEKNEADYLKRIQDEDEHSRGLKHPNIVEHFGLFAVPHTLGKTKYCEVMEYCSGGDLCTLLANPKNKLTEQENNCVVKQVIQGVAFLHAKGIAHRDIKPENILLTPDGHVKLSDFGVSVIAQEVADGKCIGDVKFSKGMCGSEPYLSPEVFAGKEYDGRKLDVWSIGIVMLCLYYHGTHWKKAIDSDKAYAEYVKSREKANAATMKGADDHVGYHWRYHMIQEAVPSKWARKWLWFMLDPDPSTRCSSEELMKGDWVKRQETCIPEDAYGNQQNTEDIDVSRVPTNRSMKHNKVIKTHNHFIDRHLNEKKHFLF